MTPRLPAVVLLLTLVACVRDAPLPDPGPCADLPEGVYEYGQMGIGTCLAGPTDLAFLADGRVLAVSNANPWKDFTGGSALFLDLSTVDFTEQRNVLAPQGGGEGVAATALALPSFSGDMALAASRDLLLVTNRLSEDARTRESEDPVVFLDVSDPDAPAFAGVGPDGEPSLDVGWDPVAVHYAPGTDLAWVVNRTGHDVAMVDLAADPVRLVPPGGPSRLDAGAYVDADGSGSRAGFVTLAVTDDADIDLSAKTWDLRWSIGTVRLWASSPEGAFRVTGNGESTWLRSNVAAELDVADADGAVLAVNDPHYFTDSTEDASFARMVFEDQGVLRAGFTQGGLEQWAFEAESLLEPSADDWDAAVGGPAMVRTGSGWYLFYDGSDGDTASIGLATSGDGASFRRASADPVLSIEGASITDPFVLWDASAGRWRMYYTLDGASIGEATSENLEDWTAGDAWAPSGGASAPAVGWYNGAFHLFYVGGDGVLSEAVSIDGSSWSTVGPVPGLDAAARTAGGVALQVETEEAYTLADASGTVLPATLTPGERMDTELGWELRVAVGQVLDPDAVGASSLELTSVHEDSAYFSYTYATGERAIGVGAVTGPGAVSPDPTPLLEAGAGGAHDRDGVHTPVVTAFGGELVMYYAAAAGDVTTIGRATSPDGLAWSADDAPVLVAAGDWESVAIEPGSVQVLDDGTLRLWYSAFDGARWRIGLAESTDGVSFSRVPGVAYDWVFDAGAPGAWYDTGVRHPYVVRDGDTDRMWFAGDSGEAWQIGYASRVGDDAEWSTAEDAEGTERPVLAAALGGFGIGGVARPVAAATEGGWSLWYAGLDDEQARVGRAVGAAPDRLHRDLRMPTLADSWSVTYVPARDGDAISLDVAVDGGALYGGGCSALAEDEDRGFLYVGCKLVPYVYVLDIRDDSTADFEDLNYLDVEGAIVLETSTGSDSGLRALLVDRARGWLWGVGDEPEGIYAIDLSRVEDDADIELIRESVVAILPLPRALERDEGAETQSTVGPANLAMHPDGHHLFVTNFNANSVSVYDLSVGPVGTLVADREDVGENPYAIAISPDGTLAAVANYAGEVEEARVSSSIALLDADPASPTFLQVKTWLVNQ